MISEKSSLKFFEPKLPAKITCNSSKFGIGAVLEQKHNDWHPVAFKSRSWNREQLFSSVSKFNEYLYVKKKKKLS